MAPILYLSSLSPPSRAVLITGQALNLELELRNVDLSKGEHRTPEYIKLNPLHAVPTLDDDGTIITDSHAINAYLVSKYAPEDSLYPQDIVKRALVDQRLHFDTGILFNHFRNTAAPLFYRKSKEVSQEQKNRVLEAYKFVEIFLENSQWVAGDEVTIADFSIGSTILALNLLVPLDVSAFPKTDSWIKRFQGLEYTKVNEVGLQELKKVIEKCMA
ncbi:GST N 3 domain containing protein [Asbolus verrucosus]|uniref:GST N 3 domain containing protein n=1 Tax=Asbolus verrucosus TaxID=1661398 RepID=A0A482VE51_ASBVE|nr:GST N 3 domain containing protein [Asbolus verrucosus]